MISIHPLCLLFSAFHRKCLSIRFLLFSISPITPKSMLFYVVESCNWKQSQLDKFKQPQTISSTKNPWNLKTKSEKIFYAKFNTNSSVTWIMIHNRRNQKKVTQNTQLTIVSDRTWTDELMWWPQILFVTELKCRHSHEANCNESNFSIFLFLFHLVSST